MQNFLIYGGIAINIIGALLLMGFAIMYCMAYREIKTFPKKVYELKSHWYKQRLLAFGMMIGGALITVIGCFV